MIRALGRFAIIALLALPACDRAVAPRPPEPGVLTVRLTTPNTGDAALTLTLVVPAGVTLGEIEGVSEQHVLFHRTAERTTRIALIGDLSSGPIVRFAVPDVNAAPSYSVRLAEVADDGNALRALTGYAVSIAR